MPRKSQAAKRPHDAPSFVVLDASAAKAKLKAKGDPKDAISQKMLPFIDRQLNEIYSALAVAGRVASSQVRTDVSRLNPLRD